MADVITTSAAVQITLVDALGKKTSFNIDNPKQGLSMAQIKAALGEAILSGYWYSSWGDVFTAVIGATITESKKIKLDNSEAVIYITPAHIVLENTTTSSASVLIEGANVIGAYITQIATEASGAKIYADCNGNTVTVTANFPSGGGAGTTALLNIVTDERTVTADISVNT